MPNIRERKDSSGKVTYTVQIRIKGQPPQSATFDRKTDAKIWAQKTEADIRAGRYFPTAEAKRRTVEQMIDKYMEELLPHRGRDRQTVEGQLQWWKNQLGSYFLADVTPQMVADCRDRLVKENINAGKPKKPPKFRGPATVHRYLATLSVCFSYAVKDLAWTEENPLLKVRKPSLPEGRVRFLSDEERENLLAVCKNSKTCLYTVVVLALSTGARMSEIMHLQWKDIDFQRRIMRLEHTKNGDKRAVPLSSHPFGLVQALNKVRRIDSTYLFPRADGQKPFEIKKHWLQAVETAGLTDFKFHDLRHTAASYLAMNGATLLEISNVLGHKQLKMVKRYAHLSEPHTANVLERMNAKQFAPTEEENDSKVNQKA
jgi:integrase